MRHVSLKLLVHHVTLFLSFCTEFVESIICICIYALYINSYILSPMPQKLLCTGGILKYVHLLLVKAYYVIYLMIISN